MANDETEQEMKFRASQLAACGHRVANIEHWRRINEAAKTWRRIPGHEATTSSPMFATKLEVAFSKFQNWHAREHTGHRCGHCSTVSSHQKHAAEKNRCIYGLGGGYRRRREREEGCHCGWTQFKQIAQHNLPICFAKGQSKMLRTTASSQPQCWWIVV